MCPPCKGTNREKSEGREGVFHGSFDEKDRCDDYSGVSVAGRVVRLDCAYDGHAIHALSRGSAQQPFAG